MTDMTLFEPDNKPLWRPTGSFHTEDSITLGMLKQAAFGDLQIEECFIGTCESPIERVMAWSLALSRAYVQVSSMIKTGLPDNLVPETVLGASIELDTLMDIMQNAGRPERLGTFGVPQCQIGSHRVDFAFVSRFGPPGQPLHLLAVECDGHDFHERTKEQAQRDKSRDRDIAALGVHVIRFTGSEIWRDPRKCAADVYSIIVDAFVRHVAQVPHG